jgi:hypothetical protein
VPKLKFPARAGRIAAESVSGPCPKVLDEVCGGLMPAYNAAAFVFDVCIGIGVALVVYALLRGSLRKLLDRVIDVPEGTKFYLRALVLILLSVALNKVIVGVHLKPDAHFMEYVWAVASDMSGIFENLFVVLLVYLGLITVLVVVLKPKNAK